MRTRGRLSESVLPLRVSECMGKARSRWARKSEAIQRIPDVAFDHMGFMINDSKNK